MIPTSSDTLLSYALETEPDPLQASPATGNTVYGSLSFVVSNGGAEPVNVTRVQFTLPQGLTNDPSAVLYSANPASEWSITMTSSGVYTAVPAGGGPVSVTTNGIVFQLFNVPVVQEVGTATVTVDETATADSSPPKVRTATFDVGKFPYGFYFDNLSPSAPQVSDGSPVTLTWEGSDNATYTMHWDDQSVDVTDVRVWTSPGLKMTTSFLLTATVVSEGETVNVSRGTTVTVADPDIDASSLRVRGVSALEGPTTVGLSDSSADLTVNGGVSVSGGAALASATVSGSFTASGTATVDTLTVNSGMTVNGGATVNQLTASGTSNLQNLNVSSTSTFTGAMSMFRWAQALAAGEQPTYYTAQTDGLVICYASTAGSSPTDKMWGYVQVNSTYGGYAAIGTNYAMYPSGSYTNGLAQLAVPMPNGGTFTIFCGGDGSSKMPLVNAWWVPLGFSGGIGSSIRTATPEEVAKLPTLPSKESLRPRRVDPNQRLADLVEVLKSSDDEALKAELAQLLGTFGA